MENELYTELVAKHGRHAEARATARRACRPLRILAAAVSAVGAMATRCFRTYEKVYQQEISTPPSKRKGFDHHN